MRVPCVVVNPYIKRGLIARPGGYVPFDHTSVIKTVQNCFQLQGNLTERDKAAPDFSCLLTLDASRKADIPAVTPLQLEVPPGPPHVNDLHRVIAKVLEDVTGKPAPDDTRDLMKFIEKAYKEFISNAPKRAASRS